MFTQHSCYRTRLSAQSWPLVFGILVSALLFLESDRVWAGVDERGEELYKAVSEGDVKKVAKLLEKGADVDYVQGKEQWRTLHVAARKGYREIVPLLIEAGADLAAQEHDGWSALHLAAYSGHTEIVEALMEGGAPVDATTEDGWTAVDVANSAKHTDIAALIAAHGGKGRMLGPTLYNRAAAGRLDEVGRLLSQGASVDYRAPDDNTPLHVAAFGGHLDVVHALLSAGAGTEAVARRHTPLTLAVQGGHTEVVAALADAGSDVNIVIVAGRDVTPLNIAAGRGHTATARVLIDKGADPKGSKDATYPPLFDAVTSGKPDLVALLLENGADVNSKEDWVERTALHEAVHAGDAAMVQLLLDHGARVHVLNYKKQTPRDLAVEKGHDEIVRLLESAAASQC